MAEHGKLDNVQQKIADNYARTMAQKAYDKQVKEWEEKVEAEKNKQFELMQSPEYLESLGLPSKMPRESLHILKTAMALDKIGPQKPEVDKVYRRYGF